MTDFHDLVVPETVSAGLTVNGKKQLFLTLADMAARAYGLNADEVYDRLNERERLGSTGFGNGIAIPHAKIPGLDHVCGLVVRLETPIAFDAVDEVPVDIVFSLLSPADSGAEHLKMLARVSRYLRSGQNAARIRGAGSSEALLALLAGDEARDAA
ncbi:MAG: PTS sugar transporter subunit IIA [Sphingobium sp.]|jgi:PTS system nitrogen regulatory IIA component|nr:PTS sugar transporter subunit IIA [Sphingobium sp.]MCI1270328.1 PTS sugar transporter subunit IIA [Sphingobium sp.]MCI1755475.1 PTS sugar transporter subunit IIA [Sphingobium sp.]MCI2052147.1 PTS sugar transporter subunit IIA [Sphingobium sp.]